MKDVWITYWFFANRVDNYAQQNVSFMIAGYTSEDAHKAGKPAIMQCAFDMPGVNPEKVTLKDCWAWADKHQEKNDA